MPCRIQRRRTKGWRMPQGAKYVGRPTKWGNPFYVGCDPSRFSTDLPSTCETAADAIEFYRYFVKGWMQITNGAWIRPLRGKDLACWCTLDERWCHADVLLELAN